MTTTLTRKGQVTIPKHIRDALNLHAGSQLEFAVNADGEIVLRDARQEPVKPAKDRFEAVRGKADVPWLTQDLMALLRD